MTPGFLGPQTAWGRQTELLPLCGGKVNSCCLTSNSNTEMCYYSYSLKKQLLITLLLSSPRLICRAHTSPLAAPRAVNQLGRRTSSAAGHTLISMGAKGDTVTSNLLKHLLKRRKRRGGRTQSPICELSWKNYNKLLFTGSNKQSDKIAFEKSKE